MFLRKKSSLTSNILGRPPADIRDKFLMGKELGKGQFGVTYLCTDKVTGEQLACKSLAKRRIGSKEEVEDIRKEIAIMHHLGGHPHIVQLRGAFEDKHNVHIVMELCAGGELFDRIAARGHYSERAASALFKTMMGVVDHCHQNNVIHRDLKPENFLLADRREDAPLKVADFGLSSFYKEGEVFTETVGSAFYVAPEVLKGKYDKACDVWSCGVILFILLSGTPPFWGDMEKQIFHPSLCSGPLISLVTPHPLSRLLPPDTEKQIFHQVLKATPDFAADPLSPYTEKQIFHQVLKASPDFAADPLFPCNDCSSSACPSLPPPPDTEKQIFHQVLKASPDFAADPLFPCNDCSSSACPSLPPPPDTEKQIFHQVLKASPNFAADPLFPCNDCSSSACPSLPPPPDTEKQIFHQVLKASPDFAADPLFPCNDCSSSACPSLPPPPDTEKQIFHRIFHQVLKATPDFAADPWPQVSDSAKDLVKRMLHPDPSVRISSADVLPDPWPQVSDSAKDLVKRMLHPDPAQRISSADVLRHPWLSHEKQSDKPLGEAVLKRIKKFSAANKMKKLALKMKKLALKVRGLRNLKNDVRNLQSQEEPVTGCWELKRIKKSSAANKMKKLALKVKGVVVIACNLSREEILGLKKLFKGMDKDGSGSITFAELKTGMQKLGNPMSEEQLQQIMEALQQIMEAVRGGRRGCEVACKSTWVSKQGVQKLGIPKSEEQLQQIMEAVREGELITATQQMSKVENEDYIPSRPPSHTTPNSPFLSSIGWQADMDHSGIIDYTEFITPSHTTPNPSPHLPLSTSSSPRRTWTTVARSTTRSSSQYADMNHSGTIDHTEFITACLKLLGLLLPLTSLPVPSFLRACIPFPTQADMDHSGTIDYTEFITATMQMNKVEKEEHIWKAFQHFDRDGSGFITVSELRDALANEDMLEPGELEQIIEEVDTDKSGTIDYEEFAAMMRKQDQETAGAQKQRRTRSIAPPPVDQAPYCHIHRLRSQNGTEASSSSDGSSRNGYGFDSEESRGRSEKSTEVEGRGNKGEDEEEGEGTEESEETEEEAREREQLRERKKLQELNRRREAALLSRDPSTLRYAYVTLLCDDVMAPGALVLVHSLKRTGTPHDVVVLTMNVSEVTAAQLQLLGARVKQIEEAIPYPFPATPNRVAINKPCRWVEWERRFLVDIGEWNGSPLHPIAHGHAARRGGADDEREYSKLLMYSKLWMWTLTEYHRLVYVDADLLVMSSLDDLFCRDELSAAPDTIPPDRFNSGLMVVAPSDDTFRDMLSKVATTKSPNVGDQGLLNNYFSDWYSQGPSHHLPYAVNPLFRLSPSPDSASLPTAPRSPPTQVATTKSPNVGDQGFLNNYFSDWYSQGPSHHLPYAFNPLVRLSGWEGWEKFVQPQLRFPTTRSLDHIWLAAHNNILNLKALGEGTALILSPPHSIPLPPQFPTTRSLDHIWLAAHNDMLKALTKAMANTKAAGNGDGGSTDASELSGRDAAAGEGDGGVETLGAGGEYTPLSSICQEEGATTNGSVRYDKLTVVLTATGSSTHQTMQAIRHYASAPVVQDIFVLLRHLSTVTVLVIDDTILVPPAALLATSLLRWREAPNRLLGFLPSAHFRLSKGVLKRRLTGRLAVHATLAAVLVIDDTFLVPPALLATSLLRWRETPNRLLGFLPSAHFRLSKGVLKGRLAVHASLGPGGDYSVVTGALLLHRNYLHYFCCTMREEARGYLEWGSEGDGGGEGGGEGAGGSEGGSGGGSEGGLWNPAARACADVAMNMLVTHLSDLSPLTVYDSTQEVQGPFPLPPAPAM
ncbi:unnamed protein product [Closterium sp. NIES-65]|nr:unnamed protein product [Closterium sp. NIES-65]